MSQTERQKIVKEIQKAVSNDEFTEKLFSKAVCHVLDDNGVEYETEYKVGVGSNLSKRRRCDIYIPATDTAIELKLKANMRGVGQCAFYSRYHSESILMVNGDPLSNHSKTIKEACIQIPGVKYALCKPGIYEKPTSKLDILTNDDCDFFRKLADRSLREPVSAIVNGFEEVKNGTISEIYNWPDCTERGAQ